MATAEISNPQRDRLIIVSNRLPITLKKNNEGTWSFSPSSGGLVSALSDFKKTTGFIWVGWPGFEIPETEQGFVRKELNEKFSCIPVFLNKDTAERFYDGFSNRLETSLFCAFYEC